MDYTPINLAPKGVKQGDYFTTTIGPYDYWAIEYAYKPLTGGTDGECGRAEEDRHPGGPPRATTSARTRTCHASADPQLNVWDLGADPMKFAQERIALAEELLEDPRREGERQGRGLPADARGVRPPDARSSATGRGCRPAHRRRDDAPRPQRRPERPRPAGAGLSRPAAEALAFLRRTSSTTPRSPSRRPCSAAWPPSTGSTGATAAASASRSSTPSTNKCLRILRVVVLDALLTRPSWPGFRTTPSGPTRTTSRSPWRKFSAR